MIFEAMLRNFFVTSAGTAVIGEGINADTAPGGEESGHFQVLGIHQLDQVLHDCVHAIFMEGALVAEAEQIELEALA